MKNITRVALLLLIIQFGAGQSTDYSYVAPKPNSTYVSNETNIIIRSASAVDRTTLSSDLIRVQGSLSGMHDGIAILSDDGKTIVFNPLKKFSGNEDVIVTLQSGLKNSNGSVLPGVSFQFTTMPQSAQPVKNKTSLGSSVEQTASTDLLPAPPITIDSLNNPSEGYIFLATWDRNVPLHKYANYLFILDHNGNIIDSIRVNGAPFDFRVQPNGRLSYGLGDYAGITPENSNLTHYVLDSTLAVVDSFQMKNGYLTDFHDFIHLPNGHAMLMSYHTVTMDMSLVVPGGRTDALVVINIFQEQDADKNVVFEWRDIDNIPITDTDLRLTDPRLNPSTLNGFDLDDDGNLLFSFRNHSDIMKINRETGDILWRWGGLKNEFSFVGEHQENAPFYFARQHNILRLPNGNVTLYDNGEFHVPPYSRSAEYLLDEKNKTATLVSEYRYAQGNIFTQAAGNAKKLTNGGWFVGYGILSPTSPVKRNIVETHGDGTIAFELSLPANVSAYRASKHPWRQYVKRIQVSNPEVLQGNTYSFNKDGKTTGVSITFNQLSGDFYNNVTITRVPYGPVRPEFITDAPVISPVSLLYSGAAISSHQSELHIDLNAFPEIQYPNKTSIFLREFEGQGLFIELPTAYDSIAQKLIATSSKFGEIVFGAPDYLRAMSVPLLIEPLDRKKIISNSPALLKWSGRGLVQSFTLQLASDSLFQNVIFDTTTSNSYLFRSSIVKNQTYYWRVKANASSTSSAWSTVWYFIPTDEFMTLKTPNGGEQVPVGKPLIVRWETNIADSVEINVIHGQDPAVAIGKSYGGNNAYLWNVSSTLAIDSTYRISIVSFTNPSLGDTSNEIFSLTSPTGVAQNEGFIPNDFALFQNYPNPFNPSTTIEYYLPENEFVSLTMYDVLGKQIGVLVNSRQSAGSHRIQLSSTKFNLSSGIYFYLLRAGTYFGHKSMVFLK